VFLHQREQVVNQAHVIRLLAPQPEFPPHALVPVAFEAGGELIDRVFGQCNSLVALVIEERQQGLGQAREIPMRYMRLIAIGVAAMMVNRTQDRRGVIRVQKGARAIVN
jgi:hypothetical protein